MTSQEVIDLAGLQADQAVARALALRADVLEMTDVAEEAVLRPKDPGGFSHGVRAALAVRIARLNKSLGLVRVYDDAMRQQQVDDETLALAEPGFDGGDQVRWRAVLVFTDRVATSPKQATAADVESLRTAGIAEPDIVRLTQLNAFLAYKIRLVEGLKLMAAVE